MAGGKLRARTQWLLALTLAGLLLRTINLEAWPLWSDEAMTLLIAQWPWHYLFLVPVDPTPGLYYALHKAFLGPDVGVAAARSISVITGTLTIPATFLFAQRIGAPALLSAGLVALSFPLIDYSQEARAYALLVLLVVLSAWAFAAARWWVFALTCVLAFYTHFASIFWIGPAAAFAVGKERRAWPAMLCAVVLAVPEVMRLWHYPREEFAWLVQPSPWKALQILMVSLAPAVALLPFLGPTKPINSRGRVALLILLAAPVLIWAIGFVKPIYMQRTILIALPAYLILLALCLRPLGQLLALPVFATGLLITGTMREREDWRSVTFTATPILCQPRQAAAFRHSSGWNGPVVLRYSSGEKVVSGSLRDYFSALSTGAFPATADTNGTPCLTVLPPAALLGS